MDNMKRWYTLEEAAAHLNRCTKQILRYVQEGKLKGFQAAERGKWNFDVRDLNAFMRHQNFYSKLTGPQKQDVL